MTNNSRYFLLRNDKRIVGWKRETTEYLPLDGLRWRLEPIEYNDTQTLSAPPTGVARLPRQGLGKGG